MEKQIKKLDLYKLRSLGWNLQPTNVSNEWLLYSEKYYTTFKAKTLKEALEKSIPYLNDKLIQGEPAASAQSQNRSELKR